MILYLMRIKYLSVLLVIGWIQVSVRGVNVLYYENSIST